MGKIYRKNSLLHKTLRFFGKNYGKKRTCNIKNFTEKGGRLEIILMASTHQESPLKNK